MSPDEKVVKHLEMTQGVINRLAGNSFSLKSWSMALLGAVLIFIARNETANTDILYALFLPIVGFWWLDSFYLWQERLFREVYNNYRTKENSDFDMNPTKHMAKAKCCRLSVFFSQTVAVFYIIEIITIGIVILILKS